MNPAVPPIWLFFPTRAHPRGVGGLFFIGDLSLEPFPLGTGEGKGGIKQQREGDTPLKFLPIQLFATIG